jgi:hypothetical protein
MLQNRWQEGRIDPATFMMALLGIVTAAVLATAI